MLSILIDNAGRPLLGSAGSPVSGKTAGAAAVVRLVAMVFELGEAGAAAFLAPQPTTVAKSASASADAHVVRAPRRRSVVTAHLQLIGLRLYSTVPNHRPAVADPEG